MNITLSTLPHPVSSTHVQLVAELILRMPGRRAGPNGFRANGTSGTSDSCRSGLLPIALKRLV